MIKQLKNYFRDGVYLENHHVDNNKWDIEISDYLLTITDKITSKKYNFSKVYGYRYCVLGQYDEDTFLVGKYNCTDHELFINLKKLSDNKREYFISSPEKFLLDTEDYIIDDNIIIGYNEKKSLVVKYSIKDSSFLKGTFLEGAFWTTFTNLKFEEVNGSKVLIAYNTLTNGESDFVKLDPATLKPISKAYSSLRDSFIDVETGNDFLSIVNTYNLYIDIIKIMSQDNEKEAYEKILNS